MPSPSLFASSRIVILWKINETTSENYMCRRRNYYVYYNTKWNNSWTENFPQVLREIPECKIASKLVKNLHENKCSMLSSKHQFSRTWTIEFYGPQTKNQDYFKKYCLFIKLGGVFLSGLVPLMYTAWIIMSNTELQ